MNFNGKIDRNHENMRVEFAQMCALEADHSFIYEIDNITDTYDVVILLIPKTESDRNNLYNLDIVTKARRVGSKVWFMQEGPAWIFQDMPLHHQFWHYNVLAEVDGILTENTTDIPYFKGLVPDKAIIGGNFCRWYGGFDSYITAQEFKVPLFVPTMGRKIDGEEQIEDLTHLPYMNWKEWIYKLAEFKYAVHLMPTIAAGTFAMNCAYLGIPCIGYREADTQRMLHPALSVKLGDIETARKLCIKLQNDDSFYKTQSETARQNYKAFNSEREFVKRMGDRLCLV